MWRKGGVYREVATKIDDDEFKKPYERIINQRGTHLHVLMGNPPYSKGQSNYNDQNQNIQYPELNKKIR